MKESMFWNFVVRKCEYVFWLYCILWDARIMKSCVPGEIGILCRTRIKMNHCYSFTRFFPNKCFIVVKWYCNSTFICMLEIFLKFAKASLSRIFLAACKSTFYGLSNNIRVDQIWMRNLVTANQLISGTSQN